MRPRSRVYFASREKSSDVLLMRAPLVGARRRCRLEPRRGIPRPLRCRLGLRPRALRFAAISETHARPAERITWYSGTRREATRGAASPGQERAQVGPEVVDDDSITLGGRMNAVGLIQARLAAHAVEEERQERGLAAGRDLLEHGLEVPVVARAVVGREPHASDEDPSARRLESLDDRVEVLAHAPEILTAKGVVGAELDDGDGRLEPQRPVHAAEASSRRVPGDSGVDHAIRVALRAKPRRQQRRIRELGRDAEPGGEAVAERDDHALLPVRSGRGRDENREHDERSEGGAEAARVQSDLPAGDPHGDARGAIGTRSAARPRPARYPECSMKLAMISVREVSMRLASGGRPVDVLTCVSLDVPGGQFLAVAGPSGSGKSTLLGLIAGLDAPTAGRIEVAGVDITGLDEDRLARFRRDTIGYVFQSYHLIPTLTALENVAVPLELSGDRGALDRAAELLDEVGLADRARHYPVQLSGGEQQRVAVARAVARRPRLLLADEPTGNLDSGTGKQVIALLVGMNRDLASTLVLVTHDVALAAHADRIVTLRDGRVVSDELSDGRP